jgi:tetratricopeptide (TPR) repeat protein
MPHDVFISYSSIDKAAAFAACATFEANGIRCWIAPRDVAAGSEWAEQIIDAIAAAKVMVLIFSANSNESRQVKREIELAINRGLTVMPIRLEQIEPTRSMAYYMAGVHWLDALTPPLETHFRKMVDWIKPQLGPQPDAPKPKAKREETPPKPKLEPEPPRPESKPPAPAAKPRRKSSGLFGDLLFEFFGVGAKEGGIRIGESGKAINAARALADAGKPGEAIAAYRALIERIEDANVANLDWNLSIALLNLAITYRNAGRTEEALATYRTLERSCGDITDELVEKQVAMGMNNHGNLLMELDRPAEAIPLQDAVIERHSETINTDLAQQLAIARLNRGVALGAMRRNEAAIIAYDEMIDGTNLRVWPKLDDYVAMALVNKAMKLAALGRTDQALATYDDVVSRFGSSSEDAKRQQVANALCNKANLLIDLKRHDEAVAACDKGLAIPRSTDDLIRTAALTMRNKVAAYRAAKRKAEGIATADKMLAEFGGMADKTISEHVAVVRQLKASL